MFDYIKTTYKKGDKLKLTSVNGEFSGEILFISADSIILKTFEGKTCGIKGSDISFFEEIESLEVVSQDDTKLVSEEPKEPSSKLNAEEEKVGDKQDEIPSTEDNPLTESNRSPEDAENVTDNEHAVSPASSDQLFEVTKPQIKVVGHIDLDSINQRTRPKKSNTPKTKTKAKQTFSSFDALGVLVEDVHKAQNEKLVPSFGEISYVNFDGKFGFISDGKTGRKLYFNFGQIIDPGISISSGYLYHLPVVYSVINDEKGDKAISIHRPAKVAELIKLAEELSKSGQFKQAISVLDHILKEYPDNFTADSIKSGILKAHPQSKPRVYANLYAQAKKFHLAKDYAKAIEYFIKAIDAGEKLESSIKDLGSLYVELYSKSEGEEAKLYREKAIKLLDEHENDLSNSISTLNYLEGVYYSIQHYDVFIEVARELLEKKELTKDKSRSSLLLCKIATAYIRLDDLENAAHAVDEALLFHPNNTSAIKLKDALENDTVKELIDEISATEFDSLNSGLSSFIQQTLEEYDEYFGVPPKIIESGDFNEVTLNEIRKQIETAGRARPRKLAQEQNKKQKRRRA